MIGFILTGHGQFSNGIASAIDMVAGDQPAFQIVPFEGSQAASYGDDLRAAITAMRAETDGVRNQAASDATLTYSVRNLPEGASFDAATHTFSWTPDLTGDYTVTFIADDGVRPVETDVTIHVDGTLWQKAHSAIQRIFL